MNQDREKLLDEAAVAIGRGFGQLVKAIYKPDPHMKHTIESAIHTMRTVADNLQNCGDAMQWNWAQCNVYDLRRDAEALEKSLVKPE